MTPCGICLGPVEPPAAYHTRCLRRLFHSARAPSVRVELAKLHTFGLAMAGRTSISGVQRKISVSLTTDRMTLQLATDAGRYLLKPASETFPALPRNELATMRIAELAGVKIPPCGLVSLADESIAYLVERFDRTRDGRKLRQEDFCQLGELAPKQKYEGSAELCARLVRRYASEPLVAALALFRQTVFAWWTGNGDMHLKNLSLLLGADGLHRLSPAYDLLCTDLVVENDQLALPVGGNRHGVTPRQWLAFATYCGLTPKATARVLGQVHAALTPSLNLVARCYLPDNLKTRYARLLEARARTVEAAARKAGGA